jgi:hypothetical protein
MAESWSSFVSLYGDEPLPTWVSALQVYSDEQLYAGYQRAVADNLEFPPNLSTFIEYVAGNQDWEHARQSKPVDQVLEDQRAAVKNYRLEHEPEPMTAEEALAAMKAAVGL